MVPFLFSSLYRVIYMQQYYHITEFPRNLYILGPSICHISAAECHRITNYGSKFSGERVLTEYSKIQWVLFMYKKSLNTLDIDIFFPMLRYYLGQRTHNFNDNINKHFYIVWIHCVFY